MNLECLGSGLCWGQEEDREFMMTGGREGEHGLEGPKYRARLVCAVLERS